MHLRVEGRPVVLDLAENVLEQVEFHQPGVRPRLDDVVGREVAARARRTAQVTSADDVDPIGKGFSGLPLHVRPYPLHAGGCLVLIWCSVLLEPA